MDFKLFNYYPFLREIPEKDLASLDLKVLEIPNQLEYEILSQLSFKIDKNIVIYNKFSQSSGTHLCRYLKFAKLNALDFLLIEEFEKKLDSEKVIVAYEKPLTFS